MNWKTCGWCGVRWNPRAKKGWLGKRICPKCEEFPRIILHRLVEYDLVKLKKKSKMPPPYGRKRDWGHLGTFDPSRPWMKWKKCKFCTQPIALNNNAEHQVRIRTYKGYLICAHCIRNIRLFLPKLEKMKYLKIK